MKGRERKHTQKWIAALRLLHPSAFIYKIIDSPIARKPFDCFMFLNGTGYAIEFKMADNDLTPHQLDALKRASAAGAVSLAIYFGEDGKVERTVLIDAKGEKHDRSGREIEEIKG